MTPWKAFLRSALMSGLAAALIFSLNLKRIERLPIDSTPPVFDGHQAHEYMTTLAKRFPNRTPWSDSRRKAALWLKQELRTLGYEPQGMNFSEVIDGKLYNDLENVYAEKRGSKFPEEIIVVAAHYDITDTTVEGAMDDASGVGVVLELARIFSKLDNQRTLVFLLTDSEEFGAFWGAREFVRQYERIDKVVAMANFDFVAPEKQTTILTLTDGLKEGFTPLWLREMALNSLRTIGGFNAADFTNIVEYVERGLQIPPADHGPFLAAGIPAFNWVGQTDNFTYQMAHYHHTNYDVAEAMRPESFSDYGRAAERLVRSVDALSKIPANFRDSNYWKISQDLYVDGWVAFLINLLAFMPFLVFIGSKFMLVWRTTEKRLIWHVLVHEGRRFVILLSALLLGYGVILLLPTLNIITKYEAFPATQKSLLLYKPNFVAVGLVLATILGVYLVFRRYFRGRDDLPASPEVRQTFHGAFLALIILLGLMKNSYLTALLLLPPAYFWTAIRAGRRIRNRILNTALLLAGTITFTTMTIVMGSIFHVGNVYWYLFLSASYGLVSAYTVVLFFMAIAVMIRLFRAFVL